MTIAMGIKAKISSGEHKQLSSDFGGYNNAGCNCGGSEELAIVV